MKINVNYKKLLLLGGVSLSLLLSGCHNGKKMVQKYEPVFPYEGITEEEETLIGMVLDSHVDGEEKAILEKYTNEEVSVLYENAISSAMFSYAYGYEDEKYLDIIKDYDSVMKLHDQFFVTYHDQNDETIKKLYCEIREFMSTVPYFNERSLASPIIYASQLIYRYNPSALMKEELMELDKQAVFPIAKGKIKLLRHDNHL